MLAKSFSADLVHRGIRVNSISSGFTATSVYDENFISEYQNRIPIGKVSKPKEIAKTAIVSIITERSLNSWD